MGKPVTLLERLCAHCLSFGAQSLEVESRDRREWISARLDGKLVGIANWPGSGAEAREVRSNLASAAKRPVRTVINGKVHILRARACESVSGDPYEVTIEQPAKRDPAAVPGFTARQGQYLAFIDAYIGINRRSPAEADLERYFQVSPPTIHEMIKTLERNGLIERTPGQARSIRLLVGREHLPRLG